MWLVRKSFSAGDTFVSTHLDGIGAEKIFAQGFIHQPLGSHARKRILLINKRNVVVSIDIGSPCTALLVDSQTNQSPPRKAVCDAKGSLVLTPFATAVVD